MSDYNDIFQSKNLNPGNFIVRAFIVYLREMFKANDDLNYKIYDDDQSQEEALDSMLITSKYDWEEKWRKKTPAIVVSRQVVQRGTFGTQGTGRVTGVSNDGSVTRYTDMISVPIVIDCISLNDIEAEVLSSICQSFLSFEQRIIRKLGIQIQSPPAQTPAILVDKSTLTFMSSVILGTSMQISYGMKTISDKVLTNVDILMNNVSKIEVK